MEPSALRSAIRKLRRLIGVTKDSDEGYFTIGKMSASLIPAWIKSDYPEFEAFLQASGLPYWRANRVAEWGLAYYEVPSLHIWKMLGSHQVRCMARYSQDECREVLLANGVTALDLLMIA